MAKLFVSYSRRDSVAARKLIDAFKTTIEQDVWVDWESIPPAVDWLEEHRRLQVRALEWHRKKDPSLLLRGRDLRNARHMFQTYTSKDPTPTELQQKYIDHSTRTERNRTSAWMATAKSACYMS